MPFQIVHQDITQMETEAIVNAANPALQMGGGVCGAIFSAAGRHRMQEACGKLGGCPVGGAVITPGFGLKAKYVIHAVGPIWQGGKAGERKLLEDAYRNSLELAKQYKIGSIGFPLISSGIYGYPRAEALRTALDVFAGFLAENEMEIYLVVFDRGTVELSEKLFSGIRHYIDRYYVEDRGRRLTEAVYSANLSAALPVPEKEDGMPVRRMKAAHPAGAAAPARRSLEKVVSHLDETFSEMLLRLIDEKGKTDVQVYKKANIDRKLFSKIRSSRDYSPKKSTAMALAIGLELSLDEAVDLLARAGYSFSPSSKFDVIVRYFLEQKCYDMFEINEALFYFEQPLLGA